jgi:hypothetical protein
MKMVLTGVNDVLREINKIVEETVAETAKTVDKTARKETPVRTGYTQSQWKEKTDKRSFKVENKVPWIERLEAGASKQAPRGIIGPTLKTLKGKTK